MENKFNITLKKYKKIIIKSILKYTLWLITIISVFFFGGIIMLVYGILRDFDFIRRGCLTIICSVLLSIIIFMYIFSTLSSLKRLKRNETLNCFYNINIGENIIYVNYDPINEKNECSISSIKKIYKINGYYAIFESLTFIILPINNETNKVYEKFKQSKKQLN